MMRHAAATITTVLLTSLLLTACGTAEPEPTPTLFLLPTITPTAEQTPEPEPTLVPVESDAVEETSSEREPVGPTDIPDGINPLTGLEIDPERLERRPLLVKVSNESPEVRPLTGLSFADNIWLHQMEGWGQTRITAVYWSQSPDYVGSVRSVRPIDSDTLIPMYDGIFAYSGSSIGMTNRLQNETPYWQRVFRELQDRPHLVRLDDVPREGTDFYHRLFAVPEAVWESAELRGNLEPEHTIEGLAFDDAPPADGVETDEVIVEFPEQRNSPIIRFTYKEEDERWLMFFTDRNADVPEEPFIDRLNGEQLGFNNILIVYTEHEFTNFAEDSASGAPAIDGNFTGSGPAILVRDGLIYEDLMWEHDEANEGLLIQIRDAAGDVVPLNPGQTMFITSIIPEQEELGQYTVEVTAN